MSKQRDLDNHLIYRPSDGGRDFNENVNKTHSILMCEFHTELESVQLIAENGQPNQIISNHNHNKKPNESHFSCLKSFFFY